MQWREHRLSEVTVHPAEGMSSVRFDNEHCFCSQRGSFIADVLYVLYALADGAVGDSWIACSNRKLSVSIQVSIIELSDDVPWCPFQLTAGATSPSVASADGRK